MIIVLVFKAHSMLSCQYISILKNMSDEEQKILLLVSIWGSPTDYLVLVIHKAPIGYKTSGRASAVDIVKVVPYFLNCKYKLLLLILLICIFIYDYNEPIIGDHRVLGNRVEPSQNIVICIGRLVCAFALVLYLLSTS